MKNLFQFNIKTLKSDSDILSDPKNNFFQTFHIDKNDSFPSFLIDLNTKNTYFSDQRQQNLEEKEQNISSYNSILDENKKILKIRQKNDHCFIVPTDKSAKNLVWRVLNKGSKDYFLQENDVVKLGNGQFKILCMQMIKRESSSTEYYAYNSLSHSKTSSFFNISTPEDKSFIGNEERKKIVCRFCNSDEISMNNILIRPCECRSYIHLQCYRTFLQKSMKAQYIIDSSVIIENDSLVCENCMKNQMLVMNFCNAKKDLLDLQCFLQYMIIEKNDGQTLIINLDRHKDIFFGRTEECHVKFADNTVSEVHCRISFKENGLTLSDCQSKIGTSVQLQKPLYLEENSATCLQMGNSIIKIKKKPKKPWFLC